MSAILERTIPKTEVYQNGQVFNARLISVKEYDEMIRHGILTAEDKVELLNGVIIEKMPKGTKHSSANDRLTRLFYKLFGDDVIIRNQNPIWLDELSEPEPDIVLAKFDAHFYSEHHPTPEDVLLIIEISDSTLGRDRITKSLAYAKAGIRQYIVFNVQNNSLEDYRQPAADGYQSKQTYRKGDSLNLAAFPEIEIKIDDLF
ncbi:Uma2 family endonuclease [soil metagenome]